MYFAVSLLVIIAIVTASVWLGSDYFFREWVRLIGFGLTLSSSVYGATFYSLIGLHGLHVAGALVWLLATTLLAARQRFADGRIAPVQACAMYWHFVVGLWPVLFVAVYLL